MTSAARPILTTDAAVLLDWHLAMGVDEAVGSEPRAILRSQTADATGISTMLLNNTSPSRGEDGRGALGAPAVPNNAPAPSLPLLGRESSTPLAPATNASVAGAVAEATRLAAAAETLDQLRATVMAFEGCPLKKTASNTVFADGNPASGLMLIGEAPGAEEDKQGIPFCGPSGKLLDKMLQAIGRDRETGFYISNTLFWRPPGNRQPTPEELEICRPFVEKHIALVKPRCLLLVGGTATKAVLGESRGITRLRGQVFSYSNPLLSAPIPTHVIYHPSFLLRQPLGKRQTWADLLALKAALAA